MGLGAPVDYRRIFEAVPGLYLLLAPDLRILGASDAYLRATMTRREDIVGKGLFEVFPDNPDDPQATGTANLCASLQRVLREGVPDTMAVQKYDIRRPEEEGGGFEERFWSPVNSPVLGPRGEVVAIIHRVEDVTEFVRLRQRTTEQTQLAESFRTRTEEMEAEVMRRAQELQQANARLRATNEDLAERERQLAAANRRLQEVDELKTRFFANVSHELRTPLGLILGPVGRLLADPTLPPARRRDLEVVERNAQLLLRHVNDLLDLAKLDAGKLAPAYAEIDLAAMLRRSAGHFESLAGQRRVALEVEAPETLTAQVDPGQVERVMLNLISNAVKFTPEGGRIRCSIAAHGDAGAELRVADTGPGVPEALREAVFERFHQGSEETARRFGGTGLGLAIVKDFAALHGGAVRVEDAPGGGAAFVVTLPRRAPPGTTVAGPAPPAPAPEVATARAAVLHELAPAGRGVPPAEEVPAPGPARPALGGRVLVVDDNPEMRRFVAQALRPHFEVETAADGAEGLEKALALGPDLVVSDIMMPRMDGAALLRALRQRAPADLPVLLLSARADDALRVRLLREGAQDYVTKPFAEEELVARARNLVLARRADEARREAVRQAQEAELLRSQQQFKAWFINMAAHEMNTPLTPLVLQLDLLERSLRDAPAETRRSLAVVRRGLERLERLARDILDLARIEAKGLGLQPKPLDLRTLTADAVELMRPLADAAGVRLRIERGEPSPVLGDPVRLAQVLHNLLRNAIKFSPAGAKVVVAVGRGPGGGAEVRVRDACPGIAPKDVPKLFQPFSQLRKDAREGSGLGLYIARTIVDLHGGRIACESPPSGPGCVFRVELPLPEDAPRPDPPRVPVGPEAPARGP